MLNVSKGNMYGWVTHTWNTVKGECPHGCHYCYMKRWGAQRPVRFVHSELRTKLGSGKTVFVGSSCDMWADSIDAAWIARTLVACRAAPGNRYLFQSKNPAKILAFKRDLPGNVIIGTTIESDRMYPAMGAAPEPRDRAKAHARIRAAGFRTMVTIEPVMDFSVCGLVSLVHDILPNWVNIGANTGRKVTLPEPDPGKLAELIAGLERFTAVRIKPNLKRILNHEHSNGETIR